MNAHCFFVIYARRYKNHRARPFYGVNRNQKVSISVFLIDKRFASPMRLTAGAGGIACHV